MTANNRKPLLSGRLAGGPYCKPNCSLERNVAFGWERRKPKSNRVPKLSVPASQVCFDFAAPFLVALRRIDKWFLAATRDVTLGSSAANRKQVTHPSNPAFEFNLRAILVVDETRQ
jgi:hypothetical protein